MSLKTSCETFQINVHNGICQSQYTCCFQCSAHLGVEDTITYYKGQLLALHMQPCCPACTFYCELECGPMPNLMVALPNVAGALCSTPQSLADAHY